ncbi:hypothetical protein SCUP515_04120 [Seiridium cupressi]
MTTPGLLHVDLADQYRRIYRAQYREDVAAGNKIPFLFHLCFWGIFIIPILYLSIPHKRRPWLYHARWLVLALCTSINVWMVRSIVSANFAFAYGTGICAAWGTIWNLTLFVWTRPQWDAKRVQRYPNPRFGHAGEPGDNISVQNYSAPVATQNGKGGSTNGHVEVRQRKGQRSGDVDSRTGATKDEAQEKEMLVYVEKALERAGCEKSGDFAANLRELNRRQPFIYEWQEFPEDASFLTRLDWAFDIATTMRLTGWSWAIHVLPPYRPPPWFDQKKTYQAPLDFFPDRTSQGYTRCHSRREFFRERLLLGILPCYIITDVCATLMTQDPYFVLGPNSLPLPPELRNMNPFGVVVLSFRRTLLSFVAIIAALRFAWDFGAILLAFLGAPVLRFRVDPWHLPSMTGSFQQVLDRGLAGFWGSWWHQTFRFGFAAPTKWLIRNGYIRERSTAAAIVGALVAFVQSGFLHSMGSYTTVPKTHFWEPPIFFFLSGIGTSLQSTLSKTFKTQIESMPRWGRRAGNLLFAMVWLHFSSKFLLDDFGRCGIWLWEPVPFSFARLFGYGVKGDHWWRWGRDDNPSWITGKHWWDSGIGI